MPPSQLKRLKTSLREQGITGPQKSKKQKKAAAKGKRGGAEQRVQRNAALQQIRDSFNPFELKAPSRPAKFPHASSRGTKGASYRDVLQRPGVTKSAGEEMRRATLLPEMQRRHKVGGLVDRRIGEGDPGMTAEERAVQRFAQEKSRRKGASLFDLEHSDEDEPTVNLTHGGRSLDELPTDDFGEEELGEESSEDGDELLGHKRRRQDEHESEPDNVPDEVQPERKRSKKEVMEEVVAKSKLHKYERQKAKEDDDDLRQELDLGVKDLLVLLNGHKPPAMPAKDTATANNESHGPAMNPDRQKLLDGIDRTKVDKEYDARLKQLALDSRAKPSERTKTEEEKAAADAEKLKDLEERRMKRMHGEEVSDEEELKQHIDVPNGEVDGDYSMPDEAAEFGFTNSIAQPKDDKKLMVLDDEDEFALDDDLIASGSDVELSDVSDSDEGSNLEDAAAVLADEEDEFVQDIIGHDGSASLNFNGDNTVTNRSTLAYTYPCPRSHSELQEIIRDTPVEQLPTIIQRIRALYHPSLSEVNKEGVAEFSCVLVDHLSHMGANQQSLEVIEQVIRHLHSLSRTYPEDIANTFRRHLREMHERKDIHGGDLVIFTAIGSIYPTSDHFHQVVTPAMTVMARWLGLNAPDTTWKQDIGAFLVALSIRYSQLSKRYLPEALRFTMGAVAGKSALSSERKKGHVGNLMSMAQLWKDASAFPEIFTPVQSLLQKSGFGKDLHTLKIMLVQAKLQRRPLELHHHRPLPIRTSIPKFEEAFNPDKHYDPDKERSDAKKLQNEYKRERKGALRELRKDSAFMAREQLKEKRERDREYEKKYRRLVAEIQGQEGHEAKEYAKEKRARKRGR